MDQSSIKLEKIQECDRRQSSGEQPKTNPGGYSASNNNSQYSNDSTRNHSASNSKPTPKENGHAAHANFTKAFTKEQVRKTQKIIR